MWSAASTHVQCRHTLPGNLVHDAIGELLHQSIASLFSVPMLHPAIQTHHSAYAGCTICIADGAGFIGSHIADTLVECSAMLLALLHAP